MVGEKRVWLYDWKHHPACHLRGKGSNGWERQSAADLHGASAAAAYPELAALPRWRADLTPGSLLYIPSNWLHEVHARTPSFSLGWRFAMVGADGGIITAVSESKCPDAPPDTSEADQLHYRCRLRMSELSHAVQAGTKTEQQTLVEAMNDPELRRYLRSTGMPIPAWAPAD